MFQFFEKAIYNNDQLHKHDILLDSDLSIQLISFSKHGSLSFQWSEIT